MTRHRPTAFCIGVFFLFLAEPNFVRGQFDFESPPINYLTAPSQDRVARLQVDIDSGRIELPFNPRHGYLEGVLNALEISVDSQMLVFSQTSFQLRKISPHKPRALYFNDDSYVGWVQHSDVMEIGSLDPKLGCVFYTLDLKSQSKPIFKRDRGNCLTCHASSRTQGTPGLLVRSVFPSSAGVPLYGAGTFNTDHTSPFDERWGGWYVSGIHGAMRHMGNVVCPDDDRAELDREVGANRTSLSDFVDTDPYLSPHSDIVALMVHEHQTQLHNAITFASYEYAMATHHDSIMNEALKRDPGFESDSTRRRLDAASEKLVRCLLFCNEFQLTSPVQGVSGFTESFAGRGPSDGTGRSLRQFDLNTRLFKYPCSYLIYSPLFDALPDPIRGRVFQRLVQILDAECSQTSEPSGPKQSADDFAHLSFDDRSAIREILRATKPEFAAAEEMK